MRRIPDRLTKVDARVGRIFRRLGFITARLYFKPLATADYLEVEVFEHTNKGWTLKNWKSGSEVAGHRHSFKVSAEWWLAQAGTHGTYGIRLNENEPIIPCAIEGSVMQDADTSVSIDLLELQQVGGTYG